MTLYIIATPIGHPEDISLRSLNQLKKTNLIICESTKESSRFLKKHQITGKQYELLNEHSTQDDILEIIKLLKQQDACLVSDCGTPSFCDPGFQLITLCRNANIKIQTQPGASSLMGLLSLSSLKLEQFYFRGFLPANNELRKKAWQDLKKIKQPIVLMDTPYRLEKMVKELEQHFSKNNILLNLNLTQENETVLEGKIHEIKKKIPFKKAEFMILIYT
ncbi:methyltransferase [bacterium K02(2017)]|nr:methyltransferase [bacterium K02(2017)]